MYGPTVFTWHSLISRLLPAIMIIVLYAVYLSNVWKSNRYVGMEPNCHVGVLGSIPTFFFDCLCWYEFLVWFLLKTTEKPQCCHPFCGLIGLACWFSSMIYKQTSWRMSFEINPHLNHDVQFLSLWKKNVEAGGKSLAEPGPDHGNHRVCIRNFSAGNITERSDYIEINKGLSDIY